MTRYRLKCLGCGQTTDFYLVVEDGDQELVDTSGKTHTEGSLCTCGHGTYTPDGDR